MVTNKKVVEFEWDKGNIRKNLKHKVTDKEVEEVFFDKKKQRYPDLSHSKNEIRKVIVGETKKKRRLFVVYTERKEKIRIISARDLNKRKEVDLYEKAT